MKKQNYYYLLILFMNIFNNLYSHKIVLTTRAGESISIDSEFLTVGKISSKNSDFLSYDTINCPTVFKKTLERVSLLLDYRKEIMTEHILDFFNKKYIFFSVKEIADLLNTFDFLNLESFLELALVNCPINKEKEIFSLCYDALQEKIQLFNTYLRIKVPLYNGTVNKYIDVPFNIARLLPRLKIKSAFFKSANEKNYQKSIEIELPEDCMLYCLPIEEQEQFFNIFFKIIKDFKASGKYDYNDIEKLFYWYRNDIAAIFCNLLDFFQLYSLLKSFVNNNHLNLNNYFGKLNSSTQAILRGISNNEKIEDKTTWLGLGTGLVGTMLFLEGLKKIYEINNWPY